MSNIKPSVSYLPNLTPLRGIAALLTVIFHVDLYIGMGSGGLLRPENSLLLSKLYLMVDFFFVLSGFIMYHVYGKLFASSVDGSSFKKFAIARFARVYPLHFFTLLYLVGLRIWFLTAGGRDADPFATSSFTWESIPTNLLLIQSMNIHNWFTWNNAAWSISTEWWMYMIFPFLVLPFMRLSSVSKIAIFVACFAGYVFIMLVLQHYVTVPPALSFIKPRPDINVAYQFGFLRCLFGFVIGMIIYLAYKNGFAQRLFANGTTLILSTLCLAICLHFGVPDVFTVMFYPLIILSAAYGSKNIDKLFGNKVMQRLGDWSFSIYMVHQPIVYTFFTMQAFFNPAQPGLPAGPPPPPGLMTAWTICLVFIAFTLLLSWLTYKYVEVPSRNWLNNSFKTRDIKSNLPTV